MLKFKRKFWRLRVNVTTVVFDGASPPFILQTLRDGTAQAQTSIKLLCTEKQRMGFSKMYFVKKR